MDYEPPTPAAVDEPSPAELHPVRVVVTDDLHRSRLTVFFRLLLAIPHYIWFVLWSFFAFLISIVNWFITLIRGRSAESLHDFYCSYVRYTTHLYAYFCLAANPYPGLRAFDVDGASAPHPTATSRPPTGLRGAASTVRESRRACCCR